jgi:uncharacterized protein
MRFIPPLQGISNSTRLLLLIGLIILGAIVTGGIAYIILVMANQGEVPDVTTLMDDISSVRIMQIFNQLGVFIIPPLLLAYLTELKPTRYLAFNKGRAVHYAGTILMIIVISPIVGKLMQWNEAMRLPESLSGVEEWMRQSETAANEIVIWLLSFDDPFSIMVNVVMVVLLPAIGEELVFRSALIRIFNGMFKNVHVAIWISAIIFSAFHLQFFGFLPRMFLGLIFGYLFIWSGTIWVPVLAHLINNGTVVAISYLNSNGLITETPEDFGSTNSTLVFISGVILSIALGYWFYRTRANKHHLQDVMP